MKKYRCLVVDDEVPAHRVIHSHISKTDVLEVVGDAYDGKEALDFLTKNKVDIVFLDIEMPKLTGIELLQCLPYPVSVILTTAYNNFGYEAYENDVVDYLLKPISFPRFLKAVNKVVKTFEPIVEEEINYPKLEFKHEGVLKVVDTEQILYVESIGNYIKIHLEHEKPMLVTQTMKYLTSVLPAEYFIRIHKSYIVKRAQIVETRKTELVLSNNVVLPVGRKFSVLLERH